MASNAPRVLLRSEETDGEVAVIEIGASPERKGPPLHHHDFDASTPRCSADRVRDAARLAAKWWCQREPADREALSGG